MSDIQDDPIVLNAKNSSGKQELFFDYHIGSGDITATLVGEYNGNSIQIDFDEIPKKKVKKMIKRLKELIKRKEDE